MPLIGGRYVLGEPFASGGMGSVHLGRIVGASGFSRVVAIKRLFPGFAGDASFRQMLLDEARFASRIRQPNVVPILDVVEADRDLYVVMEYVHGLPLADLLDRTGSTPMPVGVALAIMEAVLFGLHAAHEARGEDGSPLGIVHRDVSPQNVLVGADGVPRLIDFGIAKAATRMQVTDPGTLKGKAAYMAPEQLAFEPVARHADVFSASVVLWEMLANRSLFSSDVGERVRGLAAPIPPPSRDRGEIDAGLDGIVQRGLSRDPARRFPSAEAMAHEIRRGRALATTVEVATWVGAVAADDLEISEERVRLFEQAPQSSAPSARSPDVSTNAPIVASVRTPTPGREADAAVSPRTSRRRLLWGTSLGALLLLGGAFLTFELAPKHESSPGAPAASPAAYPVAAQSASSPTSAVAAATSPPPRASAPVVSGAASTQVTTKAVSSHSSGHAHGGSKPKCDPPYTLDADGFKHYDPRCF